MTANRVDPATVLAMAEAARWAPSIHNSQPWSFRPLLDGLAVVEDLRRALPVIDPHGRERTISCGAAVLNARVALAAAGHAATVETLPDPADATLLARIRAGSAQPSPTDVMRLAADIPQRRTHRRVYRSHAVAEEDLLELRRVVTIEGARLGVADVGARRRLAHVLRRAVREQAGDPELRRETERWVRRRDVRATPDGIPQGSLGTAPFPVDSLLHEAHAGAPDAGEFEEEMARSTILAVCTRADTRSEWLLAGMALERMLLAATGMGLVAGFVDQALQHPHLRPEVADVLGVWGQPQVLLRIGRPLLPVPPTPRRPLSELLLTAPANP